MGLLSICGYEKNDVDKLKWSELLFVWYAGLIRGAIAFGLVLRIDHNDVLFPNRLVITTTCLTLVLFTTIFFGSTVGMLGACVLDDPHAAKEVDKEKEETKSDLKVSEHKESDKVSDNR